MDLFAVVGTYDDIANRLQKRFGSIVTSCEFSIPVNSPADRERLTDIARRVHAHSLEPVRTRLATGGCKMRA